LNDASFALIARTRPRLVVLSALWSGDPPVDDAGFERRLVALDGTLARLRGLGIETVVLGEMPEFRRPVPAMVAERLQRHDFDMDSMDELKRPQIARAERTMAVRYRSVPGVRYVSMMERSCTAAGCPLTTPDGTPMQFDVVHLTPEGSRWVASRLGPRLMAGVE
jgi:hypothetical protein